MLKRERKICDKKTDYRKNQMRTYKPQENHQNEKSEENSTKKGEKMVRIPFLALQQVLCHGEAWQPEAMKFLEEYSEKEKENSHL